MDQDTVIKVEHVSKKFCKSLKRSMLHGVCDIARNAIGLSAHSERLRKDEFWALDDVSFELKKGEVLGIIGANGSGKTTMLKLLNGIFWPDKGKITINGRVGALIAVGAGFHPNLTGRENIYLNGAILGMSKKEINRKIKEIIEFADIGDFIDTPVKYYSSGMNVRLGFASAIFIEPEVLLIDEVLSVGDLSFQNKSLRKLHEIKKKAGATVFVSHRLSHMRTICDSLLVLDQGKKVFYGKVDDGIKVYEESVSLKQYNKSQISAVSDDRLVFEKIEFINYGMLDDHGAEAKEIKFDQDINLFFDIKFHEKISQLSAATAIQNNDNIICVYDWNTDSSNENVVFTNVEPGKYRLIVKYEKPMLVPGFYCPLITLRNSITGETYLKTRVLDYKIKIVGDIIRNGLIKPKSTWQLKKI